MGKKNMSADEVAQALGVDRGKLKELSKKHLIWLQDYYTIPGKGVHYKDEALDRLSKRDDTLGRAFETTEDKVVWGVALDRQPPNPRFVWMAVPGVDGQCLAAVPMRLSTRYRVSGKRIPLTHIEDNLYQIAQIV